MPFRRSHLGEQGGDLVGATRRALGEQLGHEVVAVAIDDQAGQAIGLGVHEAAAIGAGVGGEEGLAGGDGALDAAAQQGGVERLVVLPGEEAGADLRVAAPGAAGEPLAIGRGNVHHVAAAYVALHPGDGAGKNPGVALLYGALAAGA